ncbi:MAG: zinc-binding dehydrogenase, partial [Alphaproteobacteria bacterium]|nr:zinc-binding dehydrogenase [Alphaproteobacteria bacterium]
VQWAKHLGATVIGTTTSPSKVALAKANGCAHVLNSKDAGWEKQVREITGGKGVPVVYDSIGKDTFLAGLDCLIPRGIMVTYGNASGPVDPFSPACTQWIWRSRYCAVMPLSRTAAAVSSLIPAGSFTSLVAGTLLASA